MIKNSELILGVLKDSPKKREEMVEETGIPRSTLYGWLKKFMNDENVETKESHDTPHRPFVLFGLTNRNNGYWKRVVPCEKQMKILDTLQEIGESPTSTICKFLGTPPWAIQHVLNKLVSLGFVHYDKKRDKRGITMGHYEIMERGISENRINHRAHQQMP